MALGEKLGFVVGREVVLVRVAVVVRVVIPVTVTVLACVRLPGVAVGDGEEVNRKPCDMEYQRERDQPPGCESEVVRH